MKKMFNVRSIVAMIIMATIATTAGCNQSTGGNQESSLAPSLSVSQVRQDEESSKDEKSKDESKVEISKDEKSKAESKVESSKEEPSKVETSKEESSKAEKSEVETSVEPSKSESSVEESLREVSKVESSAKESSKEVSKAESSVTAPSKVESSVEESSDSVSIKDAIRYGRVIKRSPLYDLEDLGSFSKKINVAPDSLIVILNINDLSAYDSFYAYETYEVLISGKKYVIASSRVELFPEDYVPDFTDEHWVGLS